MSAINSWRKLKELSWSEVILLIQGFLFLPLVSLGIKCFGFRRFYGAIANFTPRKDRVQEKDDIQQAKAIAKIVEIASRYGLYKPNCLQKSLLLWWFLQRRGLASELRIGVRKKETLLEAHAWVEYQGWILNDRSDVDRQFAAFAGSILPVGVKIL
ncbi:hypothetical protein NIES2119_26650 [[Phormidium ambiguum] IAM M-71]|uniref:Microcin J25-processing protein McjB C-terminal domain-containing protein n=1 Tax=[Phormidium ambiguum] IAM M-71 TaxID=454136 RepID=A0A1U7I7C7_9CYAN|nr:lasso peptide biosynthesis B2 protein [Phormidium ambiguum]OKH32260.1 hypothetical protein NIES2119_26650 [Phormidium ambiguum IAM M-71]